MLDHEKLDVYQCALRFAALIFQVLQKIGFAGRHVLSNNGSESVANVR